MAWIAFWIACAAATALIGHRKGRPLAALALGLFFGPLALLGVLLLPSLRAPCPQCRESIDKRALRCPRCHAERPFGRGSLPVASAEPFQNAYGQRVDPRREPEK